MNKISRINSLRHLLVVATLAAPFAVMAQPGHDSRNDHQDQDQRQNKDQRQQRPPQQHQPQRDQHRPAPRASDNHDNDRAYAFRQQDRQRMETHYKRILGKVDRSRRPHFESGQRLPPQYRSVITRAPESLRRQLPPPPAGYEIGYYEGYTLVYDPTTLAILTVIDLLNQ